MYDQKPTTSLQEDFAVLGLLADGQKKGGKNLSENADPMAPAAPMAPPAPHAEPDADDGMPPAPGAGAPPAPGAGAPPAPGAAPGAAPMAPPAPPAPPAPKADDKPEGYDDEMANFESAWNVVREYYSLNESQTKQFKHEDYQHVINALSFIVETQSKYMGPDLMDKDPSELPGNGPAGYKWAGKPENDPSNQVQGTNAPRTPKGYKWGKATPRPGEKAESLEAALSELKSIVSEATGSDEMQELGSKIVEGFEQIRDTAKGFVSRFTSELKEQKTQVDAKDPRVVLGRYFETIERHASMILDGIAKNEHTDVDDAIEDLQSLTKDLKKGLAAMEG